MAKPCERVSNNDLHIYSARSQQERALVEVKKTRDPELEALVTESMQRVMAQVEENPTKQEQFKYLFLDEFEKLTGDLESEDQNRMLDQMLKICETVEKYNVILMTDHPTPLVKEHYLIEYDQLSDIPPCVRRFDTKADHTIPLKQYIDVRMSKPIQRFVQLGTSIDIFVGPAEDVEKYYYFQEDNPFRLKGHLNTRSSINYLLFENDRGEQKVVVIGISNESKLTHTLLQLKAAGVDIDHVLVRGSIDACAERLEEKLDENLRRIVGDKPIALAIMGNRSGMVLEAAERLYPDEMGPFANVGQREKKAEELLRKHNNLRTVDLDGIFKFSAVDVMIDGKPQVLIAFRMPNGDLSRIATRLLLNQKQSVGSFVMVGAGGSLRQDSGVGSYQLTTTSQLDGKEPAQVDDKRVMPLSFRERDVCKLNNTNLTVISPLVETQAWLVDARKSVQSVDVESFFIMDAYAEAVNTRGVATMVFPGLFISDQVGSHPLIDKIDVSSAWPHLPALLSDALTYSQVEDRRAPSPQNQGYSWSTIAAIGTVAIGALLGGAALLRRK